MMHRSRFLSITRPRLALPTVASHTRPPIYTPHVFVSLGCSIDRGLAYGILDWRMLRLFYTKKNM